MLDYLNRYLVKPLIAAKRHSKHLQYLAELERTQFDSTEVVRDRQLHALQSQLQHAYETVPYYRRVWDAAGVHPSAVTCLDDLKFFPILTKADIRAHGTELRSDKYANAKLRLKTTSGSTGVPLKTHRSGGEPSARRSNAQTLSGALSTSTQ